MLRYQSAWAHRILRSTADVSSDGGTVVIHEPAQIVEVPAAPSVPEVLGAAAAVVEMSGALAAQSAPVDRSGEMIALLSEIRDDMRALRAAPPAPVIVEVIEEPEIPETPDAPEIVVAAGDIKKEEITEVIQPTEPPKKRARNWV